MKTKEIRLSYNICNLTSMPTYLRSKYRIISSILALILSFFIAFLEVIPELKKVQIFLVVTFGIVSQYIFYRCRNRLFLKFNFKYLYLFLISLIFIAIFLISLAELFTKDGFGMAGRELAIEYTNKNSRNKFFIYNYSDIPDGFKYAGVFVRQSWLPVMKKVLSLKYPVHKIVERGNRIYFIAQNTSYNNNIPIYFFDVTSAQSGTVFPSETRELRLLE